MFKNEHLYIKCVFLYANDNILFALLKIKYIIP